MSRFTLVASVLFLASSISAFGQVLDPVGFCPPPATVSACTTGSGMGNETIAVGTASFGMEKNGNGSSNADWYLLLAVPNDVGGAPTITSVGSVFTQLGSTTDKGQFLPTSSDIYTFTGLVGNNSLNASNLFCDGSSYPCASSNEISAFGSLPTSFEIFEYEFTPAFDSGTPYSFTTSGLEPGTFLAASGVQAHGGEPFSTPFTTAGLAYGPDASPVPEPASIVLLASLGLIVGAAYRIKARTAPRA